MKPLSGTCFFLHFFRDFRVFRGFSLLLCVSMSLWLVPPAQAQTSFPMITHTSPVAVQRGTTAEVTVEGQMTFHGAYDVLIAGGGIKA